MAESVMIFNISNRDDMISRVGQMIVDTANAGAPIEATFFVNNPVTDKIKFPLPPPAPIIITAPQPIGKCKIGGVNVKMRRTPGGEEIGLILAGKTFPFFERRPFGTGIYLRIGEDMWIASKWGNLTLATEV